MKVSVIITCHNESEYIEQCVNSVINQNFKDLEIILVDDGSPDNCPKICDEYARKYENITVIHQENAGLSAARNAGIDLATGKYITFIDSDDYAHPDMLSELKRSIDENSVSLAMCSYLKIYTTNSNQELLCCDGEIEVLSDKQGMDMLLNDQTASVAWGKLYDISLFETLRFPVGKICEDMFLTPLLFNLAKRIAVDSKKMYFYNQVGESITRSKFNYKMLDMVDATQFWLKYTEEQYEDLKEKALVHHYVTVINLCVNLLKARDAYGMMIYKKYKKEILENYSLLINSKYSRMNDKIKYLLMRYQLFPLLVKIKYS